MAASLEKRFRGSVQLVTLHLWRVAKSTDLEEGLAKAQELGMIKPEHETFIRACLAINERLDDNSVSAGADASDCTDSAALDITEETIRELQACALRLNTADPA